jgi:DNA topoisomerase VI subunit B
MEILDKCRIDSYDPIVLSIHIACPHFDFTETGKGALALPKEILAKLGSAINTTTREWKKAKRTSDKNNRIRQQKLNEIRKAHSFKPLSLKDAAYHSMEEAYLKASTERLK